MPTSLAAGLLIWKHTKAGKMVVLCHPGGPFYRNKDNGVWTIPKGIANPAESLLQTALREAYEECGFIPPTDASYSALPPVKFKNGKKLYAWAIQIPEEYSWPFSSNTFSIEWPPHSGIIQTFPETDKMEFFTLNEAAIKLHPIQLPLIYILKNY